MEVKKKCNILWIFFCLSKKFGPNKGMHPLEKRTLKIYIYGMGLKGCRPKMGGVHLVAGRGKSPRERSFKGAHYFFFQKSPFYSCPGLLWVRTKKHIELNPLGKLVRSLGERRLTRKIGVLQWKLPKGM